MSIEAIRAEFGNAREQLRIGYEQLRVAEDHLTRAAQQLAELGRQHSDLAELPELPKALELMANARTLAAGVIETVDRWSESL
ncbi:MAG TPA: hypothetical protein VF444_20900 [Pseudonocardiaceae bacterium]